MSDDKAPKPPPTSEQLKDGLNRGKGGDKVYAFDPAAAPLGTDDEAAGQSPRPAEVEAALRQERRETTPADQGQQHSAPNLYPSQAPAEGLSRRTWVLIFLGLGALVALALAVV